MLDEIPEDSAKGLIADLYADIRLTTGVPVVNLVFRHLATFEGALDWAWTALRPAYKSGTLEKAASTLIAGSPLPGINALPRVIFKAAGVGERDLDEIAAILDSYARANPINLIASTALIRHLESGRPPSSREQSKQKIGSSDIGRNPILKMPRRLMGTDELTDVTSPLVALMNRLGDEASKDPIAPSLFRHLAYWPGLLALAYVYLRPLQDNNLLEQLTLDCRDLAETMVERVRPFLADPGSLQADSAMRIRAALEPFAHLTIPRLVPITIILRRALPDEVC